MSQNRLGMTAVVGADGVLAHLGYLQASQEVVAVDPAWIAPVRGSQ